MPVRSICFRGDYIYRQRCRILIRIRLEDTHQLFDEGRILRHRVLGHQQKELRIRLRHAEVPARAVVELLLSDMCHRDACILRNQCRVEKRFLCIDDDDFLYRIALPKKQLQQLPKLLIRLIARDDDIHTVHVVSSFH